VSPATVSRVFSGHASVRDETRTKVLQAAEDLEYVMNGLAQAMLGTGQRSVAFVTSALAGPALDELVSGAEGVAMHNGSPFLVALTHGDTDRERAIIETLREQRTAGVLLVGPTVPGKEAESRIAEYARALTSVDATLVLCGHPYLPALPTTPTVNYDQIGGVRKAVHHLTVKGHHRIAFLGQADSTLANQRFLGYSLGLKDARLAIDPSLVVACQNTVPDAHLAAMHLVNRPDPPTAIVCLTDVVATGVYRAARACGIDIPGQLAVTGFDDAPASVDLTPSLTTVRVPFYQVGERSAQLALRLANQDSREDLPTDLIVRESTG